MFLIKALGLNDRSFSESVYLQPEKLKQMKAGIVGLPNVGKSTLFNCLSNAKAQSANFPFCTIEPNIGVVNVPDSRLVKLEELVNPERVLPATVEIVDIAGLVKGASKGEGLGNQFLEILGKPMLFCTYCVVLIMIILFT